MTKKWYESKLLWTGAAMVLGAIGDAVMSGGNWRAALLAGFGALVMVLRAYTNKELTN